MTEVAAQDCSVANRTEDIVLLANYSQTNAMLHGCLDEIRGDVVSGWLYSPLTVVRPLVFVDDTPARLLGAQQPRPDVSEALKTGEHTGFYFQLPYLNPDSVVSLYGVTPEGVYLVARKRFEQAVFESNFLMQINRVASIAQKKDTVAVVCWEGSHNPVGRAKVLYDIAATQRPVVLFCYLNEDFGGKLWYPLRNTELNIVCIPWVMRQDCHRILERRAIAFDTVWICKPRLPSFILASHISHADTRYLLDIDDNEDAFIAAQKDSRKTYDALGNALAHELLESITARTVASTSLQQQYGGHIVRHARMQQEQCKKASSSIHKIAFIGTVRPHKNVLSLVNALNLIKFCTNLTLEVHIYGDIQPPEYREVLSNSGAVLRDFIPASALISTLQEMDVVVTGFPASNTETTESIVAAQISAKISDALSIGIPVLVPETPSVTDLADVPGIYLFVQQTFQHQLLAALKTEADIILPPEFTLEGGYAAFACAEQEARPVSSVHDLLPAEYAPKNTDDRPALVLLWKQHDAGMYGRRVDQIARSYRREFPDHRVFILELYNEDVGYEREYDDFSAETALKWRLLEEKRHAFTQDGVVLKAFWYILPEELQRAFFQFLITHTLLPENTVFILFPIIQELPLLEDILREYPTIVDIVDNQISWATTPERQTFMLEQYFRLMAPARHVVFNTETTRNYFVERHFLNTDQDIRVIPNWYTLPDSVSFIHSPFKDKTIHLFYSGNMNDRMDWELLQVLAEEPNIKLHLVGTAVRSATRLNTLLSYDGILYHGVLSEQQTLKLLQYMDACIIPHIIDNVSLFMNPIKIRMYQSVGLPILCPQTIHPPDGDVLLYTDTKDCLKKINKMGKGKTGRRVHARQSLLTCENEYEISYSELLKTYFFKCLE